MNMSVRDLRLTWVLDCGDDHLETVGISAPVIGHILEGDEIRSRVQSAHILLRVAASEVRL